MKCDLFNFVVICIVLIRGVILKMRICGGKVCMVLGIVLTTPLTRLLTQFPTFHFFTFKFPVEKTLANRALYFTGGIAPMHMLV